MFLLAYIGRLSLSPKLVTFEVGTEDCLTKSISIRDRRNLPHFSLALLPTVLGIYQAYEAVTNNDKLGATVRIAMLLMSVTPMGGAKGALGAGAKLGIGKAAKLTPKKIEVANETIWSDKRDTGPKYAGQRVTVLGALRMKENGPGGLCKK